MYLCNELYIKIIEHCNIKQLLVLKNVNRFFRYYSKKIFIKKFVKKYFKNIKCNLLLKREKPLKLFINLNDNFNNWNLIKNINEISVPSKLINNEIYKSDVKPYYSSVIYTCGDIIQSFTVQGLNIKKIELYIGGKIVWYSWYLNARLINFQQFVHGILRIRLSFNQVELRIYADECDKVYGYYKYLNNNQRRTLAEMIKCEQPILFFNNNKLYTRFITLSGIGCAS